MSRTEHRKPAVFKPLIDEYLLRIAQWADVDGERLQRTLQAISAERATPFEYLYNAARKVRNQLFIERVESKLTYGYSRQLFVSGDTNYIFAGESEYDYDPAELESEDYAVVLENYPRAAHKALEQDKIWGGAGAEVVGIFTAKDGIEQIYKATPKEFIILGEDAIDYLEKIIQHGFGKMLPPYRPKPKKNDLPFTLPSLEDFMEEEEDEETGNEEE